jgi:hypothetical protein
MDYSGICILNLITKDKTKQNKTNKTNIPFHVISEPLSCPNSWSANQKTTILGKNYTDHCSSCKLYGNSFLIHKEASSELSRFNFAYKAQFVVTAFIFLFLEKFTIFPLLTKFLEAIGHARKLTGLKVSKS